MAVVNSKGILVSNFDAQPRILSNPYVAGSNDTNTTANFTTGAGDSANSTYRMCFLPSGVLIRDIQIINDAMTAGVIKLGVYCNTQQGGIFTTAGVPTSVAAGAIPVASADIIFGSGISLAAAQTTWKSVYAPTILAGANLAANTGLRIWELLGFSVDPEYVFHLVATVTTGITVAGGLALAVTWVR